MRRRNSGRNGGPGHTGLIAVVTVLIATLAAANASAETTVNGGVFNALGAKWLALPVRWAEIERHWMISTTIINQQSAGRGFRASEMLSAFCGKMLELKIGAPDKAIDAADIFRVDLLIIGPNRQPLWPLAVPVPVENGKCQVRKGKQLYVPTYPGHLAGWIFVALNFQPDGDAQRPTYVFQPRDGAKVGLGDFDFAAACAAMLADPSIRTLRSKIEKQHPDITVEKDSMLVIAKEAKAKQGMFVGAIFDTGSGKCVKQKR